MPDFEKINGVAAASIEKIDGVSLSSVQSVNGLDAPAGNGYTNAYTLDLDGAGDYFLSNTFSTSPFDPDNGTVVMWVKVNPGETATSWLFEAYQDKQSPAQGRIALQYFAVSGSVSVAALNAQYQDEVSGSYPTRFCGAKTASSHHGKPWNRISSDYGDFGSSSDSMYNAQLMEGSWHMVAMTWDTSESYTNPSNSTSYTGTMKLYIDGTLVNFGQGAYVNNGLTATAVGLNGYPSTTTLNKIRIGARHNANNELYGLIDDFGVWNATLTATQIRNLWNGGNGGILYTSESGVNMTAYYRFENNGNSALPSGVGGTLTGGSYQNTDLWP